MKVVQELFKRYEVGEDWLDPMAGMTSPVPVHLQNDLNPDSPAGYHLPALEFLSGFPDACPDIDGVLWDPPYSIHQVKVAYDGFGLSVKDNITGGFPKEKNEIARLVRPGGLVISFGWNSVGMGAKRGFRPLEYLLISHGGNRNDTIVKVEVKRDIVNSDGPVGDASEDA